MPKTCCVHSKIIFCLYIIGAVVLLYMNNRALALERSEEKKIILLGFGGFRCLSIEISSFFSRNSSQNSKSSPKSVD